MRMQRRFTRPILSPKRGSYMLQTELYVNEAFAAYTLFESKIDAGTWHRVVRKLKEEQRGNAALSQFFETEYNIVLQLEAMSDVAARLGSAMHHDPLFDGPLLPAFGFVSQIGSLLETWPPDAAKRLGRRVVGAFQNPADMRGLRLELAAATHFAQRGWHLEWPEVVMGDNQTFDLLVSNPSGPVLEVECKSIGEDSGRRIPRRAAYDFVHLLMPFARQYVHGLRSGLAAVLTVPDKLPAQHGDRKELAREVTTHLLASQPHCNLRCGGSLRLRDFDSARLATANASFENDDALRAFLDDTTNTANRTMVVVPSRAGGALLLSIQSEREDSLEARTPKVLKDAAKNQLTGERAGLLIAGFEALTSNEMRGLAEHDAGNPRGASSLRVLSSELLGGASREHVVGVAHASNLDRDGFKAGQQVGAAYAFMNEQSPYWNPAFEGIFGAA